MIGNKIETKQETLSNFNHRAQETVKFIHASDIHLGAAQYRNECRANDFIKAFQEILDLSIKFKVDFILLAGDVFTSLEMLPGLMTKIVEILQNFKKFTKGSILIIAIEGNHDIRRYSRGFKFNHRGQSWLKLLNSLGLIVLLDSEVDVALEQMFKPFNFEIRKGGKIQIKNVVIYGTRYYGETPVSILSKIRKAIIKKKGVFNILLQHFGIEGQMKNVPGIKLEEIQHLRHRVDYLALGHFHKQYMLENWIYNPGSSEAVCSIDNSFNRGIFLVKISKNLENLEKKVENLRLNNRKYIWEVINFKYEMRDKNEMENYIVKKLTYSLKDLNYDLDPSSSQIPILNLMLKGFKPLKPIRVHEKDLRNKICDIFPVIDIRVYQKFMSPSKTLDNYIIT
ncbi:MAG: exonuclease SbcCD subunit D [Promethearchaeota archaeon]